MLKFILFSFLLLNNLHAEFYYSGKINIPYNFSLETYKNTENPIRFIDFNLNYSLSNIDFKSNTAFEYKFNDDCDLVNFREYYLSYYPDFGEINIGKQIISWGFADGNNPTDNINPYDLNYMFGSGVDHKIGVHSISSIIYYNDLKINLIASYDNFQNIANEDLSLPLPQNDDDKKFEYGFDLQYNMNQAELNLSYLIKKTIPIIILEDSTSHTSQTNVHIMGINLLYLYNEFSVRSETGIFLGNNNERFYQSIIQIEFPPVFDFTYGTQLFGTANGNATGMYGIGAPIFLLTEVSPILVFSLSRSLNDDMIDLKLFTMHEILDGYGTSIGFETNYNVSDNFQTSINFTKFLKGEQNSLFNGLTSYSNVKLSLKYFF